MPISLSRDPADRWVGNRTFSVRGTDADGAVTVIIDENEWEAIVDLMGIEVPDPDDEEGALQELEKLAAKHQVVTTENGRVVDLRPNFR